MSAPVESESNIQTCDEWRLRRLRIVEESFADYEIELDRELKDVAGDVSARLIKWQKPEGPAYTAIEYLLQDRVLLVSGGRGKAIYQFGTPISVEYLSGLNLETFARKCVASDEGAGYRQEDYRLAKIQIRSFLEEADSEELAIVNEVTGKLDCDDPWVAWCDERRQFIAGIYELSDDWRHGKCWESMGQTESQRCLGHLVGLRKIGEILERREK